MKQELLQEKKGQSGAVWVVLTGFVLVATVLVLLVLLVYTFGTVYSGLESTAVSNSVTNESGWLNATAFTLAGASSTGEPRTFGVSQLWANTSTDYELLPAANYSVDSDTGIVTRLATENYPQAKYSYTYLNNSASQVASREAQSNTTRAVPLVGILLIILAVSALITILVVSLVGRRRS